MEKNSLNTEDIAYNLAYPHYLPWEIAMWTIQPGDLLIKEDEIHIVNSVNIKPIIGAIPVIITTKVCAMDTKFTIELFNSVFKEWHVEKSANHWELYKILNYKGNQIKVLDLKYPISPKYDCVPPKFLSRVIS